MLRTMMKSKIHRATVTQADLHYVGSVTVDEDLLDAADLLAGELVHIVDIDNGARLETYTIAGERGSGVGQRAVSIHASIVPEVPGHCTTAFPASGTVVQQGNNGLACQGEPLRRRRTGGRRRGRSWTGSPIARSVQQ